MTGCWEPALRLHRISHEILPVVSKMNIDRIKSKEIKPLPFGVYFWTVIMITVIGLIDSIYLSVSHYRVYTDIDYKSFCAISRAINCDTISQSSYSIFLNLPVPVWGVMGYGFVLLLLLMAAGSKRAEKKRIWAIVFWISLIFVCYSVVLAMISTYLIRSYCIMCIVSYGVNLSLLFYAWIIRRRFSDVGLVKDTKEDIFYLWKKRTRSLTVLSLFIISIIGIWVVYPIYWVYETPLLSDNIPSGISEAGHPWIGAESPTLEITEFADYQCFQCKKMHFFLRQLVAKHPDKIRLVHRNFPMDHEVNPVVREPFHEGSAALALMAISTISQDRFWQMNDVLYNADLKHGVLNVNELARKAGVEFDVLIQDMKHERTISKLMEDIRRGLKLGVNGTPAFFIEGQLHLGQIPADVIKNALR